MQTINPNGARRTTEVIILSDIHLGTVGCHAKELSRYLASVKPQKLILNGDIIDIWQFRKRYFPKSHLRVLQQIMQFIAEGVEVIYVTGNHDETLRKFSGLNLGTFSLVNKHVLHLDGKKTWIFHGDVFDITMQHSRWLTKLGSIGYDLLILLNKAVNSICEKTGREKISLSKNIKNSVKSAVKYINSFEETVASIAISNHYDYVACGHIHQPEIRDITTHKGKVKYINSGDWVENLTALEYNNNEWAIYKYEEENVIQDDDKNETIYSNKILFKHLIEEFALLKSA